MKNVSSEIYYREWDHVNHSSCPTPSRDCSVIKLTDWCAHGKQNFGLLYFILLLSCSSCPKSIYDSVSIFKSMNVVDILINLLVIIKLPLTFLLVTIKCIQFRGKRVLCGNFHPLCFSDYTQVIPFELKFVHPKSYLEPWSA